MIRVQLDQQWREKLLGLKSVLEFCDESGHVVGRFIPETDLEYLRERERLLAIPDEELDRIRDEEGEYSLEEIMHKLEQA